MSSVSDLFVSYKAVDAPIVEVPKFTPDIVS
jgi:lysozyme